MINKIKQKLESKLNHFFDEKKKEFSILVNQNTETIQKQIFLSSEFRNAKFNDAGFKVYSQHEEDGLLAYIFANIGTTNKFCVEMCAGNGVESNTANLLINYRWSGLLFDGNANNVAFANHFFKSHPNTTIWPPKVVQAWITRSNVNSLISENGVSGEIDLFSLDIDGNDYWLLEALDIVNPRVFVVEINHLWGNRKAVTTPYADDFVAEFTEYGSDYAGASLPAFIKIFNKKGYRLVGTNAFATNAFFVRNDIAHPNLPEIDPESCFNHPRAVFGTTVRYEKIKNKVWIEV